MAPYYLEQKTEHNLARMGLSCVSQCCLLRLGQARSQCVTGQNLPHLANLKTVPKSQHQCG